MKTLICTLLLLGASALAQSVGPISLTGTQCAQISTEGKATVAFQVIGGSWSGTIQPQVALAGQAPVTIQVKPAASITAQSTVTANGAYFGSVSGYSLFQICGNTITNTATVYLNVSKFIH